MHPIKLSEPLQLDILRHLRESIASTSQLALLTKARLSTVRREMICLHHQGVVQIIAAKSLDGDPPARSYYQDYVWTLTTHALEHATSISSCTACQIRNRRLLQAGGLA